MKAINNHVDDGAIRAYLDTELPPAAVQQVEAHLKNCPRCQADVDTMGRRSAVIQSNLDALLPPTAGAPRAANLARARLTTRLNQSEKEQNSMLNKLFSRKARPVWIGLALVALLAVAFAFQPVRAIANSFLGLFRVQQVTVVPVSLETLQNGLGDSVSLETMITENMQVEGGGEPQQAASPAEAAALAGFTPRLPAGESYQLQVQPGRQASFTVDLDLANAVLEEMGRSDIVLPAELDGAQVNVDMPAAVVASFGDCPDLDFDPDDPESRPAPGRNADCKGLIQMPSPTVEAPEGLDIRQLGETMLQLTGMSAAEAASFSANVDWTTTLVIPMPVEEAQYEEVSVDGVQGTLIRSQKQYLADRYMLIWVKDGVIYALTGEGSTAEVLALANALQ
ncbi:MAG TPA: zf-HC2 domain-containing protein [Anaerolineales bacterium]|nr:zf-HC2 domain-containing protein [Anaerolineales bacterium]